MPDIFDEQLVVRSPETEEEWTAYYDLRWRILRAPWHQPHGSERDDFDDAAIHCCVIDKHNNIIAIGRLHLLDKQTGQIRYMAVETEYQKQGLGTQILYALESAAQKLACSTIQLHARESTVPFYLRHGYKMLEKSHCLFGVIQHHLMQKTI